MRNLIGAKSGSRIRTTLLHTRKLEYFFSGGSISLGKYNCLPEGLFKSMQLCVIGK